ncbi:hypothetical protein HOD30_02850 [Candidatus Peregrinibacteria bacterium]|jgi:hypothetical protein|nr:hypothetical protein [Candidatus Peregrinibacteria bacterium]MBT4631516.1 hypothetical protein [Candidatus Peregrinibacteria bacterium]MBT5516989.1 hypothetical protein [Candidatus Peregrinibacteria bacterium]MBT5823905.1 hypothetical protein [Candidatus Peregrinibacteria bacterium]
MNIKEVPPGTEQASESLGDSEGKVEAQKVVFGFRTMLIATLGLLLAAGGVCSALQGQDASPTSSAEKSPEDQTDVLIARVESAMRALKSKVMSSIEEMEDEQLKKDLKVPFDVIGRNEANTDKNKLRFKREVLAIGGHHISDNPYDFLYELRDIDDGVAAYAHVSRTMILGKSLDPDNLLDCLVIYHETRHVINDTHFRQGIKSDAEFAAYMRFFTRREGEEKMVCVDDEFTAYGIEIELLNLMLDGALYDAAVSGPPVDPEEVRALLNARTDQIGMIKLLIEFSEVYYPNGMNENGVYPRAFVNLVAANYRNLGYSLYINTGKGTQVPFQTENY